MIQPEVTPRPYLRTVIIIIRGLLLLHPITLLDNKHIDTDEYAEDNLPDAGWLCDAPASEHDIPHALHRLCVRQQPHLHKQYKHLHFIFKDIMLNLLL